jgi:hypothetical protein
LSRPARDAHRAAAAELGDLAHERSHGSDGGRDRDGLAGFGLPDIVQARPGRHAGHAEDAERGLDRRLGGIELAKAGRVRHRMGLPAEIAHDGVAGAKPGAFEATTSPTAPPAMTSPIPTGFT